MSGSFYQPDPFPPERTLPPLMQNHWYDGHGVPSGHVGQSTMVSSGARTFDLTGEGDLDMDPREAIWKQRSREFW
jgi:hypothetical protein